MLSREVILHKTHYGLKLFCHFLHRQFPNRTVMHLVGRDAGMCPNPWDEGRPTLHVWTEKIHPKQTLSMEVSRFHDVSGRVPDGDCFDFAERMTGLTGQVLLEWIDSELGLHIAEPVRWYERKTEPVMPRFSFFKGPVRNTVPYREITPEQVWRYLTGPYAQRATEQLRNIGNRSEARKFKAEHFCYACFSGTFTRRSDAAVKVLSGLMCLDFDHVQEVEELRGRLLADRTLETVLLFRSPSGDGIKWVVRIASFGRSHAQVFGAVSNYILSTYGVKVDASGKDVSRACFLPFDPEAYLAPQFMTKAL